jgi:excisionase family DNA binding protein
MELLTVQDVARRLKITEQAVYQAIWEGRLKKVTVLGRIGIAKDEFDRFKRLRNGRVKTVTAAA